MTTVPMSNTSRHILWVSVGALLIVIVGVSYIFLRGQERNQDANLAEAENKITAEQVQDFCIQGGAEANKLRDAGICDRTKKIIERGSRGEQGIPGISITGPQGDTGPRGLPGNSPQCLLMPSRCEGSRGPIGLAGLAGRNGINGTDGQNGIDGKSCTPDIEGCRGPQGISGQDGKDGQNGQDGRNGTDGLPGRGIQSITCPDDNDPVTADPFLITYTDNTTQAVEGSQCRPSTASQNTVIRR